MIRDNYFIFVALSIACDGHCSASITIAQAVVLFLAVATIVIMPRSLATVRR